jgi:excisionase family DNA binding protein
MPSSVHQNNISIADRLDLMDRALTVKQLAPLLNVSFTSLYNRAREGRIPSYRIGGSVRFDPHTVAEWLRAQECKAA